MAQGGPDGEESIPLWTGPPGPTGKKELPWRTKAEAFFDDRTLAKVVKKAWRKAVQTARRASRLDRSTRSDG